MNDTDLVALQHTLYNSRNATRQWLHNTRREWISHAIRRFCPQGGCALEIGPGSGIYIPVLRQVCDEVHVSDREREYLSAIEKTYASDSRVRLLIDDITRSNLPSGHFDLVLCTEVIEHIADSRAALRHIARVLKPNGFLLLSTPQRYSFLELTAQLALSPWMIGLTRLVYREPVLDMGHINLMTAATVQAQLAEAHLAILEHYKTGLYLPGIAEFCGSVGQRLASHLERKIRHTRLDCLLWTQYYVTTPRHSKQLTAA